MYSVYHPILHFNLRDIYWRINYLLKEENIVADLAVHDLYGEDWEKLSDKDKKHMELKTFYEQKFLDQGIPINYIRFQLYDSKR